MSCGTQKAKYGIPMQHFDISFLKEHKNNTKFNF